MLTNEIKTSQVGIEGLRSPKAERPWEDKQLTAEDRLMSYRAELGRQFSELMVNQVKSRRDNETEMMCLRA